MADDADLAGPNIENTVADGLAESRRAPALVACGVCHYCTEPVPPGRLFCDADCRGDYDHLQARRKANGL